MGTDTETVAPWPLPGPIHEDPRPGMRPPGLGNMTGIYTVRLVCERVIEAGSAQAAHDLLADELESLSSSDDVGPVAADAVEGSVTADCVLDEPCWDAPYAPPVAPPSALHFSPGLGRPRAPVALEPADPDEEALEWRPVPPGEAAPPDPPAVIDEGAHDGRFRARYHAECFCARDVWARDEAHAEALLAEDAEVLLTDASLDRWTDETTGLLFWRIERVAPAGEDA